jgi:hypothetical protein
MNKSTAQSWKRRLNFAGVAIHEPGSRGRCFERPQLLIDNGAPRALYLASGLNIRNGDGSCSYVMRVTG